MHISDINFDYNYTNSEPCKAEFTVYGSFEEIANLRRGINELWAKGCLHNEFDKMIFYNNSTYSPKLLGYTTTNYSLIKVPMIRKVIFHDPATIVYWQDKTRTVVKCKDGETFDKEKGLAMCISKKLLGDDFHSEFRKYMEDNK